jgi:membrane-associated phospholipid phosphatase
MSFLRYFVLILVLSSVFSGVQAQNIDIDLLRSINHHRPTGLDGSCKLISNTVTPFSIALPASLLVVGKLRSDKPMFANGLKSGVAIVAAVSMSTVLKYGIHRERPYSRYPDIEKLSDDSTPSFPSGHTTSAFCTATSLSLMYPKWYVIVPSYSWAVAVGYSRMHMGMHYPSDVLMGAIIGTASSFLSFKVQKWIGQ